MPEPPSELYCALGKAMARWQYVETGMFLLFHGLSSSQFEASSHQFFGRKMRPTEEKLKTLNKLCRDRLSSGIVTEHWEPLHTELNQHREIRNAIAHFEPGAIIQPNEGGGRQIRLGISPNCLDLTKIEDGLVKALYVDQIFRAAEEFLATAQTLTEFVETYVPN